MSRQKPTEADWDRARVIMARSIRHGGALANSDTALLERLLAADSRRYDEVHAEEKAQAVREMNPSAR